MANKIAGWRDTALAFMLSGAALLPVHAGAGPVTSPDDPACTRPLPPDSPDYAANEARQLAQTARDGYLVICGLNLSRYDLSSTMRPLPEAMAHLAFTPVALANTPFAGLTVLGAEDEQVSNVISRLYRIFQSADGHTITLFEHDMSADGARIVHAPAHDAANVNGLPALLTIVRTGTAAVSLLNWTEGRRYYEIWTDGDVAREGRTRQLFALASSLPKSVPAHTNEQFSPFPVDSQGVPVLPPGLQVDP